MPNLIILGHRGASAAAPENTIAAFLRARELGADGVELDVALSRDGVPIVVHDDTVDRTTDGQGYVRAMTILELKQLDAGSWKSREFRNERIPTLAEVFDALSDWLRPSSSRVRPALINVELKSTGLGTDGVERAVVNLIDQKNLEDRIIVSSFNPLMLGRVRQLNPRLRRGLLYSPDEPIFLKRAWLRFLASPNALHPEHSMVDRAFMSWARRKRYGVNTWTVDRADEALRLAALGVTSIMTNRPDAICHALESHRQGQS